MPQLSLNEQQQLQGGTSIAFFPVLSVQQDESCRQARLGDVNYNGLVLHARIEYTWCRVGPSMVALHACSISGKADDLASTFDLKTSELVKFVVRICISHTVQYTHCECTCVPNRPQE